MNALSMLQQFADRYRHDGPFRRRQDAVTLLTLSEQLDEDGARVYLARFIQKWQLEGTLTAPHRTARRRPMTDMERAIAAALSTPQGGHRPAPAREVEDAEAAPRAPHLHASHIVG